MGKCRQGCSQQPTRLRNTLNATLAKVWHFRYVNLFSVSLSDGICCPMITVYIAAKEPFLVESGSRPEKKRDEAQERERKTDPCQRKKTPSYIGAELFY